MLREIRSVKSANEENQYDIIILYHKSESHETADAQIRLVTPWLKEGSFIILHYFEKDTSRQISDETIEGFNIVAQRSHDMGATYLLRKVNI